MSINNPFADALKNFKPTKQLDEKAPVAQSKILASEQPSNKDFSSTHTDEVKLKSEMIDEKKLREQAEDEQLLVELCTELKITSQDKSYYRIKRAITGSRETDMSFEVDRWITWRAEMAKSTRALEIRDQLVKRGYEAGALGWLKSLTPEGLKYGSGSRELRLEEAKKLANKAEIPLEEIARKNNLRIKMG